MKKSVCVLFGGKSEEYEVSLRSAYSVLCSIDTERYEIAKIGITRDGKWLRFLGSNEDILSDRWELSALPVHIDFSTGCVDNLPLDTVFFPVMHGSHCEDGRLQGIFESIGARYIGCHSASSFLCMDKHLTKIIASENSIPTVRGLCVRKNNLDFKKICKDVSVFAYPVFVKPVSSGSSRGASLVKNESELFDAIMNALEFSDSVLIEEYILGTECEIGALEVDGNVIFSEVGSLDYASDFYDYNTKYLSNKAKYSIPAVLPDHITDKIKEYAKKLYSIFGCRHLSRLDFFVTDSGKIYFNEINTMPGFTKTSMFPMLFAHSGYSFTEIIDILLNCY